MEPGAFCRFDVWKVTAASRSDSPCSTRMSAWIFTSVAPLLPPPVSGSAMTVTGDVDWMHFSAPLDKDSCCSRKATLFPSFWGAADPEKTKHLKKKKKKNITNKFKYNVEVSCIITEGATFSSSWFRPWSFSFCGSSSRTSWENQKTQKERRDLQVRWKTHHD